MRRPFRHTSIRQVLRMTSVFSGWGRSELARLAALADEIHVDAGEVLLREETPARCCYVVVEGWAEVWRAGRRLGALGPGSLAGEIDPAGAQQSVTVTATTPMTLLMMDPEAVVAVFVSRPLSKREEPP